MKRYVHVIMTTTKIKIFKFFTPFNYASYDNNIKVQILFPWVTTLRHKIYICVYQVTARITSYHSIPPTSFGSLE